MMKGTKKKKKSEYFLQNTPLWQFHSSDTAVHFFFFFLTLTLTPTADA